MCSKIPYSAGNESLPARWWKIGAGLGLLTKGLRIGKRRGGSCVSAKVAGKRARPAPTSPRARPALTRPSMTARSDAWGSPTGVDLAVEPKFNVPRVAEDGGGCKHQPTGRNNIFWMQKYRTLTVMKFGHSWDTECIQARNYDKPQKQHPTASPTGFWSSGFRFDIR